MNSRSFFDGEQIRFTALDPEKDADTLSRWSAQPGFVKNNLESLFRLYSVAEVKKKFKEAIKDSEKRSRDYYFAVRENKDNSLIGLLHFGWMLPTHQAAMIFLDFNDSGSLELYGKETLQKALDYAFLELSLHRLSVILSSDQSDEIALYESAGFLREVQRREGVYFDGRYFDELVYAILRPEWFSQLKEVKND